ncbi:MAG: BamA/TamA family outer membrane protein [Acidobacteria bacterium]|nr:BamA/TamA family outer membrane protein [Acidobacteriota bacterium]
MVMFFRSAAGRALPARMACCALALAFLLTPASASAQAPNPLGPAEFYLESFAVEGLKAVSEELILSESLLQAGRTYTEGQLKDAVHRIQRLPFVLDARFSLRKGSLRDRYELVITVVEARRWFVAIEGRQIYADDGDFFASDVYTDQFVVGRRFSLGKYGVLFAAVGDDDGGINVGYNHYNLFGRSILLSASYSRFLPELDRDNHLLSLALGIPLRVNTSLRLSARYRVIDPNPINPGPVDVFVDVGDSRTWDVEAGWVFNSLDDPILPTSGLLVDAGVRYTEATDDLNLVDRSESPPSRTRLDLSGEGYGLGIEVRKFWSLTRRQSVFGGARLAYESSRSDQPTADGGVAFRRKVDSTIGSLEVGYDFFLLRDRRQERWRELRWESQAEGTKREVDSSPFPSFSPDWTASLESGLVYRNGWGVYRFTFSYRWTDRGSLP